MTEKEIFAKSGSTYAGGGEITIEFEHKGKQHKYTFTPEEEDWWDSFNSNGQTYDVHYDEDYGTISVYEYSDKGTDYTNTVYSKNIFAKGGSTYNGVVERDLIETPYCCDNCGCGFAKKEMNFGINDQDLCKSCS